jgi:glycosyltransferase involved in cell wall biosynthesis
VTRLALLTEIPAPYRIPLFNALAERVDLRVLFLTGAHPDRPYDLHEDEMRFEHLILPGRTLTVRSHWVVVNGSVGRAIGNAGAVLLGGWNQPAFWEALAWCRARRVPVVLWTESTHMDWRSGRLDALKSLLLRAPRAFVVPGSAARDYLLALGVDERRVFVAPNAVDPHLFGTAQRTRTDGAVRVLAVGRLAPEKGIDVLLRAARDLPIEVVLAGTGPEEPRLRAIAGPNVTFLGNVPRDELASVYADADIVAMPSRSDPWGMVLNEAALAGKPLVSTTAAGAAWELIEDGVNGVRVPPGDEDALRGAIARLAGDERFRLAAGARSRELASTFTPDAWGAGVAAAVAQVSALDFRR